MLMNTVTVAWLRHSAGMAHLFQLWGPEAFQGPLSIRLFVENRGPIISSYCVKRKACFLAEPEWISVPFEALPTLRASWQYAQDISARVPGLMQARDEAVAITDTHARAEAIEAVRDQCLSVVAASDAWYTEWRALYPDDVFWQSSDATSDTSHQTLPFIDNPSDTLCGAWSSFSNSDDANDDNTAPLGHTLWFTDMATAKPFATHHMTRALAHWVAQSLHRTAPGWPWADLGAAAQQGAPHALAALADVAALQAALPFFFDPAHSSHVFALGPLRVVVTASPWGSWRHKWAARLLREISGLDRKDGEARWGADSMWGIADWLADPKCGKRSEKASLRGNVNVSE